MFNEEACLQPAEQLGKRHSMFNHTNYDLIGLNIKFQYENVIVVADVP